MIDAETDELLPVRQIAQERLGRTIAPATLWRWLRKGVRGVRLEAVQVLGVWHTTREAFAAFVAGQTAAALPDPKKSPPNRSSAKEQELMTAGLLRSRRRMR